MKADIRFANDSVIRCVGRVQNGQSIPWADEADCRSHIDHIRSKGHNVSIERIIP